MNGLEAANAARERMKAEGRKPERLNPAERAKANPRSRSLAIRAYCWQCSGEDADPNVRWRVGNCEIPDCALWPHRPWQTQVGRPVPPSLTDENAEEPDELPAVAHEPSRPG